MNPYALALFAAELAGAAIVGGLATAILSAFWRRHDRKVAEQIDSFTARLDALREEW